jgi:hypothetical protein
MFCLVSTNDHGTDRRKSANLEAPTSSFDLLKLALDKLNHAVHTGIEESPHFRTVED